MSATIEGPITLPLSAKYEKFVTAYINCLSLEKAAIEAGFPPERGKYLYGRRTIKAEIDRRKAAVETEVHKIIARRKVVTVEALDRSLMRLTAFSKKEIKETPQLAAPMKSAIELGYQRTGILIDGNFIPDAGSDAQKTAETPRIFRAAEQSIITHQIVETHQTVVNRDVTVPASTPDPW